MSTEAKYHNLVSQHCTRILFLILLNVQLCVAKLTIKMIHFCKLQSTSKKLQNIKEKVQFLFAFIIYKNAVVYFYYLIYEEPCLTYKIEVSIYRCKIQYNNMFDIYIPNACW